MMALFTRRKFLSLPLQQQHKKCFELLREHFQDHNEDLIDHYYSILNWMELELPQLQDHKNLADRFHWHLQQSGRNIQEHHYLNVRCYDRKHPEEPSLPIAIYLDHIRSAHNIGSILRTVEAFALGEVYFSEQTPFVDHHQVQKTSMGTYDRVQTKQITSLETLPKPIIALETCHNALSIYDFFFPESFTLVMGNEEYGCSDNILKRCDYVVEIPLQGSKNSLNVANAFAIVAAEIRKQYQQQSRYHEKFS